MGGDDAAEAPVFPGAVVAPPLDCDGAPVVGCGGVASLVFGVGVGCVFRLQPDKVSENAASAATASVVNRIQISG